MEDFVRLSGHVSLDEMSFSLVALWEGVKAGGTLVVAPLLFRHVDGIENLVGRVLLGNMVLNLLRTKQG